MARVWTKVWVAKDVVWCIERDGICIDLHPVDQEEVQFIVDALNAAERAKAAPVRDGDGGYWHQGVHYNARGVIDAADLSPFGLPLRWEKQ